MRRFGTNLRFAFAIAATPWALSAQPVAPSPAELIAKAIAAEKAQGARNTKYTFREDHIERQLDKNGTPGPPSTKTYDHIMLEGSEYRKLVLVDGKPLDAKTQKKVDDDLEKERANRKRGGLFHREVSAGPIELLGKLFDNRVTGEEDVAGRKAWRMESEPKPGVKPANKEEDQAMASRRIIWFDEEDGIPARQSDEYIRITNGFEPGSVIDFTLVRIGDDWLTGDSSMRVDVKMMPGIHVRMDSSQHYYDFRRFTVDTSFTPQ